MVIIVLILLPNCSIYMMKSREKINSSLFQFIIKKIIRLIFGFAKLMKKKFVISWVFFVYVLIVF